MASNFGVNGAERAMTASLADGPLFLALGTGMAAGALTGELSGGNYARTLTGTMTITGRTATNAAAITFPTPNATLGTLTHAAIMDAATGGNTRWVGPLNSAASWISGTPVVVQAGDLDCTVGIAAA